MATTPFSDELIARLKQATAWRFNSALGQVFTPRFFCCDDPNALGISDGKEPVAVLELSPNPAFPGDTISFDGTASYDPDGSITGYSWTFESASTPTSTSGSGTNIWAAAGEYEVKLVVTDGTSLKSSPARVVMVVKEPQNAYFIGTSTGVYFTDDGGQTWTAKNSGLSGDALTVNHLLIDPATQHLPHASKTIWIATDDGVYVSNNGGGSWTKKNPSTIPNPWGDSPAPTAADLDFKKLHFSGKRLFAIANWTNGSGDERSAVFYTDNAPDVRSDTGATVSWSNI